AIVGVGKGVAQRLTTLLDKRCHFLLGIARHSSDVAGRKADKRPALVLIASLQMGDVWHVVDGRATPSGPELDYVDCPCLELPYHVALEPFGDLEGRGEVAHFERWALLFCRSGHVLVLADDGQNWAGEAESGQDDEVCYPSHLNDGY